MNLPSDQHLPFFAYGIFKPGELAFLRIKDLVEECSECTIKGALRIRDGLPIASPDERGQIAGVLIRFRASTEHEAYLRIADLEPDKQYRWVTQMADDEKTNTLAGRSPNKGSVPLDGEWSGRNDPLFTAALAVVQETLEWNRSFEWDLRPLFRLEMAYLLLWTSIERYASLRYHLGDNSMKKVVKMADESEFRAALARHVIERREVYRTNDPTERYVLSGGDPRSSINYYYQLRSNLVHRGKSISLDHDRVLKSLEELLTIFRETLRAAFLDSAWPSAET
jgi:hypothetical protein